MDQYTKKLVSSPGEGIKTERKRARIEGKREEEICSYGCWGEKKERKRDKLKKRKEGERIK